ncbi:MAG: glycosyltransferase [Coriobacteriia bacterium]|nr:glycosyltransferase [Coriobacteriia bacterium]
MTEKQNKPLVCIVARGAVDIRTRKTAEALSRLATVKVFVVTYPNARTEPQAEEPFSVRFISRQGPAPGKTRYRLLRIAYNLIIYNLCARYYDRKAGVFSENLVRKAVLNEKPDVVYAINAATLKPCAEAAGQLGAALIYDAYEYWPDHRKGPAWAFSDSERHAIYAAERDHMAQADLAITVSPLLARAYQTEFNLPRIPLVIFNAPPTCVEVARPVGSTVKFVYLGNLRPERNVELIFEAAARTEGVDMSFQGSGPLEGWLHDEIKKRGLEDRIHVVKPVPYDQVVVSASHYDVGISVFGDYNFQVLGALPNKFFECMAAGLGAIVSPTPAFTEFEDIESFATILPEVSVDALAVALRQLAQDPVRVSAMKAGATALAPRYVGQAQAERLREAFVAMMAQRTDDARA